MGRRRTPLPAELQMLSRRMAAVAAGQGGAVTADQARLLGADAAAVRRLVGAGGWGRPRRGIYRDLTAPPAATLLSARPGDRPTAAAVARAAQHHARCADLLAALRPARAVISHTSALVLLGLPLPPGARDRVVITRAPPASANRLGVDSEVHVARFDEADVLDVAGVPVLGGARLVLDCCATMAPDSALAVADAALWRHLVDPDELAEAARRFRGRPGARRAEMVVDRADPLAESWFESASRWWLLEAGLPRPRLQVPFREAARFERAFARQAPSALQQQFTLRGAGQVLRR